VAADRDEVLPGSPKENKDSSLFSFFVAIIPVNWPGRMNQTGAQ